MSFYFFTYIIVFGLCFNNFQIFFSRFFYHFFVSLQQVVNFIDQVQCPPGTYCMEGVRRPCPQGTYGSSPGLSSSRCSGPCHAGYYCPQGSPSPIPCVPGSW